MKKKYVRDKLVTLILGATLTISGIVMAISDVALPSIGGEIIDSDGNVWETWTPEGGYVVNPEYADELAEWRANDQGWVSDYYVVDGHKKDPSWKNPSSQPAVAQPTEPTNMSENKSYDQILSLPPVDYDAACMELKEQGKLDDFIDYQQSKASTCEHDLIEMSRGSASCTEHGFISYECSKCHFLKTDDIEPTGHQYEVVEEVAVTCTEDGYTKLVCSVCGDEKIENEVKATGHTEVTEETPAGLFQRGSCIVKCSTCNEVIKNEIIPQIIPVWAAIVGGILIVGIVVFATLTIRKKKV